MFEYLILVGLGILAFYGLSTLLKKIKSMEGEEDLAELAFTKEFGEYFIVDTDYIISYSKSMEKFLLFYHKGFKFFKYFDKSKSKEKIIQDIKIIIMEEKIAESIDTLNITSNEDITYKTKKSQRLEITLANNDEINIDIDKKIDRNCDRNGEFKSFEEFYNKFSNLHTKNQ